MKAKGLGAEELRDLYEAFAPVVHRRALSMLGREADAWDAVREVFERVISSSSEFRGEARPMTYIYRVTTNVCLNLLRSRHHREGSTAENVEPEPTVDQDAAEAAQFLRVLSTHLSDRELQIAALYFVDELGGGPHLLHHFRAPDLCV